MIAAKNTHIKKSQPCLIGNPTSSFLHTKEASNKPKTKFQATTHLPDDHGVLVGPLLPLLGVQACHRAGAVGKHPAGDPLQLVVAKAPTFRQRTQVHAAPTTRIPSSPRRRRRRHLLPPPASPPPRQRPQRVRPQQAPASAGRGLRRCSTGGGVGGHAGTHGSERRRKGDVFEEEETEARVCLFPVFGSFGWAFFHPLTKRSQNIVHHILIIQTIITYFSALIWFVLFIGEI